MRSHILLIVVAAVLSVSVLALREIFVALLDGVEDLAAFVAQFESLDAEAVLVVHFTLGLLGVLNFVVVDEGVRAVLGVGFGLLHPDGSNAAILGEDLLKCSLVWQLKSH